MKTAAKVAIGAVVVGTAGGLAYYLWTKYGSTAPAGAAPVQSNAFATASSVSNAGLPARAKYSFSKDFLSTRQPVVKAGSAALPCDNYQNGILILC